MRFFKALIMMAMFVNMAQAQPLKVLTSFSIIADWVRQIGRDQVIVESMVGPDMDPHIFMPTPDTIKQITKSDVIVFNGLGLEGWWPRLITASQYNGHTISLAQFIGSRHPRHNHCRCGGHDPHDPHIWHSVPQVIEVVQLLAKNLAKIRPDLKNYFSQNAKEYTHKLKTLDLWIREQFQHIPPHKLIVITAHDAFAYFGHEYGVIFKAPSGLSTEAEPSSKDIAALIDLIKKHKIRALFLENMTNPKIMKQLSHETQVEIVGVLYSDALSESLGPAGTYIDMMKHNVLLMIQAMKMNG